MYTQFFGSYLLDKKLVSPQNIMAAMEKKDSTRVKLGVLAINAGYMTAKQVDEVHRRQAMVDKRMGDIAVEMGYLTAAQVDELLSSQKTGCLLFGQALVDMGCLTTEEFETALNAFKNENDLSDEDFTEENDEKAKEIISAFYEIDGEYQSYISEYVNILFKNLIRFVGDDFIPLPFLSMDNDAMAVMQYITGDFHAATAACTYDSTAAAFASRFSMEELTENDDYTKDVISEFLNLNNGLFNVKISAAEGKELGLTPQTFGTLYSADTIATRLRVSVPVAFTFGPVKFSVAIK